MVFYYKLVKQKNGTDKSVLNIFGVVRYETDL